MPLPFLTPSRVPESEDPFELVSNQAEAIAMATADLVSRPALLRHLRAVEERLGAARGLELRRALARDYVFTSALLVYLGDVVELVE